MNIPADLRYTKTHEWIKEENDVVTVGLSDFAQQELGRSGVCEPAPGGRRGHGGRGVCRCGVRQGCERRVQPRHRHRVRINEALLDAPESINQDPYGAWFIRVENVTGSVETLSAEEYEAMPKEG